MKNSKRRKLLSIAVVFALAFTLTIPTFGGSTGGGTGTPDPDCILEELTRALSEDFGIKYYATANEKAAAEFLVDQFKLHAGDEYDVKCVEFPLYYYNRSQAYLYTTSIGYPAVIEFEDGPVGIGRPIPNTAAFANAATGDYSGLFFDFGDAASIVTPSADAVAAAGNKLHGALRISGNTSLNLAMVTAAVDTIKARYTDPVEVTGLFIARDNVTNGTGAMTPPSISGTMPCSVATFALPCLENLVDNVTSGNKIESIYRLVPQVTYITYAVKPAATPDPDLVIVFTGHLDVVWGAPGANDNASGTAACVELARRFKDVDTGNVELIFAALGGEEYGAYDGATWLYNHLRDEGKTPLVVNLNMDMIAPGYNAATSSGAALRTVTLGTTPASVPNLATYLTLDEAWSVASRPDIVTNVVLGNGSTSDYQIFAHNSVDAVSLSHGVEYGYHTSFDNMTDNYSYLRHVYSVDLMEKAVMKALTQEVTKRAKFEISRDRSDTKVELANGEQLFKTYNSVRATFRSVDTGATRTVTFTGANDTFTLDGLGEFTVANVSATGSGVTNNSTGQVRDFSTSLLGTVADVTPAVYANVIAKDSAHIAGTVDYVLNLKDAENVLAVDFEFVVDGKLLSANSFEALNGFSELETIRWTDNGDGSWTGAVRFGFPGDGFTGTADIAKFVFDTKGVLGNAAFTITKLDATGFNEDIGEVVYYNVVIENGTGVTVLLNKYDLNKDGNIDLLDLGIMLLYVGYTEDDPEWDTLIKVRDKNGKGITAKDCDVNGDGEVDMADLIELLANFYTVPPPTPDQMAVSLVSIERTMESIRFLSKDIGTRALGMPSEERAIDWLMDEFRKIGLVTEKHQFTSTTTTRPVGYVTIHNPEQFYGLGSFYEMNGEPAGAYNAWHGNTLETGAAANGTLTGTDAKVTGEVVFVGNMGTNPTQAQFDAANLTGKIALIGVNPNATYVTYARNAGAVGLMGFTTALGGRGNFSQTANPTVTAGTPIPVLGLARCQGEWFMAMVKEGTVTVDIQTVRYTTPNSWNAIGVKPAKNNPDTAPIFFITGHIDSVQGSPGANDNASGVAVTLEAARALTKLATDNAEIRFIGFGHEEGGLRGAQQYVNRMDAAERARIKGVFNMDMTGSADLIRAGSWCMMTVNGQPNLVTDTFIATADRLGYAGILELGMFSSSDHVPFHNAGMPAAMGIWFGRPAGYTGQINPSNYTVESSYHTPLDTMEDNVSEPRMKMCIEVVTASVYDMALNYSEPKFKAAFAPVGFADSDDTYLITGEYIDNQLRALAEAEAIAAAKAAER